MRKHQSRGGSLPIGFGLALLVDLPKQAVETLADIGVDRGETEIERLAVDLLAADLDPDQLRSDILLTVTPQHPGIEQGLSRIDLS